MGGHHGTQVIVLHSVLPKDSAGLCHLPPFPPFFSFHRILATSSVDKGLGRLRKCTVLQEEIQCQEIPLRGTVPLPLSNTCFAMGTRECRGWVFQRQLDTLLSPVDQHFIERNANPQSQWLGVMCLEAARPLLPQLKSSSKLCWNIRQSFLFPTYSLLLQLLIALILSLPSKRTADITDLCSCSLLCIYSVCPRLTSTVSISILFSSFFIHSVIHSISGKIKGSKNVQDGGIAIDRNSDWILVRHWKYLWLGTTIFFQNAVYFCWEMQMSRHNRRMKAKSSWLDTGCLESQLAHCQPGGRTEKAPSHLLGTAMDLVLHCSHPHS